jgi:serine protease Do
MHPPYSEVPDRPDVNDQGGFLGIAGRDTPGGVRIAEVVPGGPADEAGVEVGDRVVAFDGTEISSMEQLADLVGATEPGTDVELVLGGPDGARTVTVTIGERP